MCQSVEEKVKQFYDSEGWVVDENGKTKEDYYFRDYGENHNSYKRNVGLKIENSYFRSVDKNSLLIAGCGDLPESHLSLAKQFKDVTCADISWRALDIARKKLDDKGDFRNESIMQLSLPENSFSAVLCAHVLYHIDKKNQEKAVRELIRVTRSSGRIVFLYSNPNAPLMLIQRFLKLLRINKLLKKDKLYLFNHPLSWWMKFSDSCDIQFLPLEIVGTNQARALIPDKRFGKLFYPWAMNFEKKHPRSATRLWSFIAVILDKK